MRRFLSSAWLPFTASLVLGVGCAVAFVVLKPTGADVGNDAVLKWFKIGAYATGPVSGVIAFLTMAILNGSRRIVRLRNVALLHPLVVLLGLLPWLAFGYQLVFNEPRFTPFGRAAIDFIGAPLWWGSLAGCAFAILCSLTLLIPTKKKR
jgi:hypothetical protein